MHLQHAVGRFLDRERVGGAERQDRLFGLQDQLAPERDASAQRVRDGRGLQGAELQRRGVVQSVLTGSIQPNAMLKVRELGLADRLDLGAGGYENGVYSKAALLELARTRAGERHGTTYPESATVYVADSPRDVQAAHIAGSPIIAVATGSATEAELREVISAALRSFAGTLPGDRCSRACTIAL
jgi:phosphoglycolate phosphatase-like HAD superfamily hydrolase